MADPVLRAQQDSGRYLGHVRPVDELVDELVDDLRRRGGRGWLHHVAPVHVAPVHVAPVHGGVRARLLLVLRDPGPMTQQGVGSGYLCVENDDPTAEQQARALAEVGIDAVDTTSWNAYPWYVNRRPTAEERQAGADPLVRLVDLMPDLQVVLLPGRDAQDVWRRAIRRRPDLVDRDLAVLETYHPGRQALWSLDPAVREQRRRERAMAYRRAADLLRAADRSAAP